MHTGIPQGTSIITIIAMQGSFLIASSAYQKKAHVELLFLPLLRVGNTVELTPPSLTYYVHARERERERKREKAEGGRREGGRGPTRAERGEETEKKHVHAAPACPYSGSPMYLRATNKKNRKKPRPAPRREGGEEGQGGRERAKKNGTRKRRKENSRN